jgi:CubicO group peptidase (beta-lactamase class C family)
MEDKRIPGLAVVFVVGDKVVWAEGFGFANVEDEVEVTPQTPFMLASISKTFTGTAMMQAIEAGAFALETPVNDLLNFEVDNPRVEGESIEVQHLVTHTSGIRDNWSVWDDFNLYSEGDSPISLDSFLRNYLLPEGAYYDEEANFVDRLPGQQWTYGNVASALAGHLVEAGTGMALDDHSDKAIFEPLGMTNSGWHLEDHDVASVAVPYTRSGTSLVPVSHYGYPDYPDGQLRASVADLGRYAAALLSGGQLDGDFILSTESVNRLFSPPLNTYPDQGVFWFKSEMRGHTAWGHSGGDLGVQTDLKIFPEAGFAFALLINSDQSQAWTGLMQIERELIKKAEKLLDL